MIKPWNMKHSLIAGVVIILLSNTVALSGVYYNRSGEPDSTVTLTERELRPPYYWQHSKENSGLALRLNWRVLEPDTKESYLYRSYSANWFDEKKLAEIGFDVDEEKQKSEDRQSDRRILPREALLVLEYDGESFKIAVERAERKVQRRKRKLKRNPQEEEFADDLKTAKEDLKQLKESGSRLYVIDASPDQEVLRKKYPDRSKYIITKGQVRMWLNYDKKKDETTASGYVSELNVNRINISKRHRPTIDPLLADKKNRYSYYDKPPRYAVKVSWGKRLEPWLQEIVALKEN